MKVSLERALSLAQGTAVVADNTLLDYKVSYWLGRLGAKCESMGKTADKEREKFRKDCRARQDVLEKEMKSKSTQEEKDVLKEQVEKINEEFRARLDSMILEEEEIGDFKKFKLSDFKAKEDIKHLKGVTKEDGNVENKEFIIKAGQSLVPVEFFKFMDDFIEAD